jgi:nucleoside phosphorylase
MSEMRTPSRRRAATILAAAIGISAIVGTTAEALPDDSACTPRTLILAAMPLELNPIIRNSTSDPDTDEDFMVHGRKFFEGTLAGAKVTMAMTRVGMMNAEQTTQDAIDHYEQAGCPLRAILFSGVAGSSFNIGDVTVPARWANASDSELVWTDVDTNLLAVAQSIDDSGQHVGLTQDLPVGDAACLCPGAEVENTPTPVRMPDPPAIYVGGNGRSSDFFGDSMAPCGPRAGDVAGCEPCFEPGDQPAYVADFVERFPTVVDPAFWSGFARPSGGGGSGETFVAGDMETAATSDVAAAAGVPFLGIRAVSDGGGDPLHLPGFPAQFFVYRQLAGNNAAALTVAVLEAWTELGQPTEISTS